MKMEERYIKMTQDIGDSFVAGNVQLYNCLKQGALYINHRNPLDVLTKIYEVIPESIRKIHAELINRFIYNSYYIPPEFYGKRIWPYLFDVLIIITNVKDEDMINDFKNKEHWVLTCFQIYSGID